jgi:hypothetical protein
MTYTVVEHGDILEREAAQLIAEKFPNYELVWQIYIGNKGNNSMAEMPNYPDTFKRKHFAENSYTVLESVFIIDHILKQPIFHQSLTNFVDYIEFNKAFITVFALLGRIHDTVIKASDTLKYDNTGFKESIHKFYEARSIVMHGKKVPLIFDDIGLAQIPFLKTKMVDGIAWDDKRSLWSEVNQMDTEYVIDKLNDFFRDLLYLVNEEYAAFYNYIIQELKSIPTSLHFEYSRYTLETLPESSGSVSLKTEAVDVYGFYKRGIGK